MLKFRVHLVGYASASVDVEADNEDEAVEKAIDLIPKELCFSCSGWHRPWTMEIGTDWSPDDGESVVPLPDETQITPTIHW